MITELSDRIIKFILRCPKSLDRLLYCQRASVDDLNLLVYKRVHAVLSDIW